MKKSDGSSKLAVYVYSSAWSRVISQRISLVSRYLMHPQSPLIIDEAQRADGKRNRDLSWKSRLLVIIIIFT